MSTIQLQQTPIIPGESTKVTLPGINPNGGYNYYQFLVPPGKAAELPKDIARLSDLTEFVSGQFAMAATDLPVFGLHWDTPNDHMVSLIGDTNNTRYSVVLAQSTGGTYRTHRGNTVLETGDNLGTLVQYLQIDNATDGQLISFPTAYTSDNVNVNITPIIGTSGSIPNYAIANPNRWNFVFRTTQTCTIHIQVKGNVS